MTRPSRGPSRRAFVRSAVALGGASAFAACLDREADATEDVPQGEVNPDELPERQHAWNDFLAEDDHGNHFPPEHHVLLCLEYVGDGPTDDERDRLERAFTTLERAYPRGNEGLLFTIGYGPTYFDRFEEPLPETVDLPEPEPLTSFEDPDIDAFDALLHLASDHGHVLLGAEEALAGELEEVNGIDVEGSFEDVFAVADRRTGFVGAGLPADEQAGIRGIPDSNPVPEEAPFFMGFRSGFRRNQATEDRVTIDEGPFAGGTTTHLSRIRLNLRQWYEQDSRDLRVAKLFSPGHADDERVEGVGDNLGDSSGVVDDDTESDARSRGLVGHAQKAARARDADGPPLLRRDVNTTDDDEAGLHFLSHQESIADFVRTRTAMTGEDLDLPRAQNGILQYITVRSRANYLVAPRRHRSLPTPNPE